MYKVLKMKLLLPVCRFLIIKILIGNSQKKKEKERNIAVELRLYTHQATKDVRIVRNRVYRSQYNVPNKTKRTKRNKTHWITSVCCSSSRYASSTNIHHIEECVCKENIFFFFKFVSLQIKCK